MSLSRRGSSPATSPRTGHWSRSSRSRLSNYLPSSGGIGGCECNVFLKGHAFPGRSGFCLHRLWIWWCLFFCLTRRREKGQTMIHPQSETHGRLNNSNKAIFSLQKLLARADLKRLISYCTFQAPQKVVTIFYNNKKKTMTPPQSISWQSNVTNQTPVREQVGPESGLEAGPPSLS